MYKSKLCSIPSAEGKQYMIQNLHRDIVPRKESVVCIRAGAFYRCGNLRIFGRKCKGWEGSWYAFMLMAVFDQCGYHNKTDSVVDVSDPPV